MNYLYHKYHKTALKTALSTKVYKSCITYDLTLNAIGNRVCSSLFLGKLMVQDKSYNYWAIEKDLSFIVALLNNVYFRLLSILKFLKTEKKIENYKDY